jgi:NitT/TauT family transport system substrate-binding protein
MLSRRSMIGATAAALTMGPRSAEAQALAPITMAGVPEDSITPVLYGVQAGIFKKNGLDVTVSPERSGPAIVAGVAGGAYQIGKSSITPLILAHAKGLPFVIVAPAGLYSSTAQIDGMFVRVDSPIKTGADLNGKTFGVYGIGDIYTISARAWVEKNGGDPSTIKFVELPISAMVEAIASGRVDAGAMNEPAVQVALLNPKLKMISHPFTAVAPRFLYTAWFASTAWATAHHKELDAFAKSMREAATYVNGHHTETIDLISKFTSVDPATIAKMTRVDQGIANDPALVQPVIDEMAKSKAIPTAFDAKDLYLR